MDIYRRTRIIRIDYVVTKEKAIEEIKTVEEGNRIELDHVPLEVELEGASKKKKKEGKSGEECVNTRRDGTIS